MPYLLGRPSRAAGRTRPTAFSPGRHISCPIMVPDNSSPPRDERSHTHRETRGGSIVFQAGTVRFALAPHVHPTMVAIAQYPAPRTGVELEFEPSAKRKFDDEIAAEMGADVFWGGRQIEHNPVASTSTARIAIPTSSGRKRLCVEAFSKTPPSTPAASSSPAGSAESTPALFLTPSTESTAASTATTPTPSANQKGKGRAL